MPKDHSQALQDMRDLFALADGDEYTQDWAEELPEQFRTPAYFKRYVRAVGRPEQESIDKQVLMELILSVADDLERAQALPEDDWAIVCNALQVDFDVYAELIRYWALYDEDCVDGFAITPRLRSIDQARREQTFGESTEGSC